MEVANLIMVVCIKTYLMARFIVLFCVYRNLSYRNEGYRSVNIAFIYEKI